MFGVLLPCLSERGIGIELELSKRGSGDPSSPVSWESTKRTGRTQDKPYSQVHPVYVSYVCLLTSRLMSVCTDMEDSRKVKGGEVSDPNVGLYV